MSTGLGFVAVKALFGASLVIGFGHMPAAHAAPQEDEPGWSCVDDGNRVCGPGNSNHVPAGCYDDGGVRVNDWPCEAWKPSDGYRHGDGSVTYREDCQINLWSGEIACAGRDLGPDWDYDPISYNI